MPLAERFFEITEDAIEQILLADNSDDEDNLPLDEEDRGFLDEDVEKVGKEIVIERPVAATNDLPEAPRKQRRAKAGQKDDINFIWKPWKANFQKNTIEYEYGNVNIDVDCSVEPNAYEVFEKTCGFNDLAAHIVEQSNLYMKQKGVPFQTDAQEIRAFLGMNLVMGYHVLPSLKDYWSTDPDLQVPYIAKVMPRQRFEAIRSALHFSNNEEMLPKSHPDFDRAFKVRPVMDHFNRCFQNARNPSQQQSVDEHMIRFKGHSIMKQYIKNKPIKWGFKMWCRCDSKTGYLYQFDLYTGKKTDTEHGLGEGVVLMLTKSFEHLCCEIYIDNFFNSPILQLKTQQQEIYLCGTARADRKHMPKNLKQDKELKRGESQMLSANGITCVKWMDNRSVVMLSNFLHSTNSVSVSRRQQKSAEKIQIPCPEIIVAYNNFMGGVNLMDQKKITYEVDRKSKIKYYLRIFFDLIDIAVNNAHCIFTQLNLNMNPQCKAMTPLQYRQLIARFLIGNYTNRKRSLPAGPVRSSKNSIPSPMPEHKLAKMGKRKRCAQCAKDKIENRTDNICEICQVHLCYTSSRNCFEKYHT
uniref:PiggyBac transposable element-derived protein 4-like n=1 Tax=Geotrypetes seraphini TaxID=260995 RepID=A0A6P8QNG6_GEOSA|nr:piggyBac transposable element-derived protein 4-like [Geotrypetes seraphini]